MQNLFVYGTLMCEDIMEEVSGCFLPCVEGRLSGFCRRAVKREHYPAIFPDDRGIVAGILYMNVPPPAFERLDRFEGEMYARRSVQVEFDYGTLLPAETYVIRPEFLDILEAFDWDYEAFLSHGKRVFHKHYRGFRLLDPANQVSSVKPVG
ncbi:MAG TPA: gamma-glutamylcyclotransferase family protein [Smithellaceae bacterium]|nr:gamma-glutamylcyclotransferase family protein [Smithellaceae bacterium]